MKTITFHWNKPIPPEFQEALLHTHTDSDFSNENAEGFTINSVPTEIFVNLCKKFPDQLKANALFLDDAGNVTVGIISKLQAYLSPASSITIKSTLGLRKSRTKNKSIKTLYLAAGVTLPVAAQLQDGSEIEVRNDGAKVVVEFVRRAA